MTAFNKEVNNWIAWTPHGILWTPSNIKMFIRTEQKAIYFSKEIPENRISFQCFYGYTISETTSSELAFDASVGKQLIYVPLHKVGGVISVSYKNSVFTFNQNYTGIRFSSTDNLHYLDAYNKASVQLDQKLKIQNTILSMFIRVDNLFDTDYQSVLNRPEPLRNYSFGINITYIQKITLS